MFEWCLRWCISHSDSVCMLCWLAFNSSNFFTRALSVNADMLVYVCCYAFQKYDSVCSILWRLLYIDNYVYASIDATLVLSFGFFFYLILSTPENYAPHLHRIITRAQWELCVSGPLNLLRSKTSIHFSHKKKQNVVFDGFYLSQPIWSMPKISAVRFGQWQADTQLWQFICARMCLLCANETRRNLTFRVIGRMERTE